MGKSRNKKQRKNGHTWRSKQFKRHSKRSLTDIEQAVANVVDKGRPAPTETYFGAYVRSKMPPLTPTKEKIMTTEEQEQNWKIQVTKDELFQEIEMLRCEVKGLRGLIDNIGSRRQWLIDSNHEVEILRAMQAMADNAETDHVPGFRVLRASIADFPTFQEELFAVLENSDNPGGIGSMSRPLRITLTSYPPCLYYDLAGVVQDLARDDYDLVQELEALLRAASREVQIGRLESYIEIKLDDQSMTKQDLRTDEAWAKFSGDLIDSFIENTAESFKHGGGGDREELADDLKYLRRKNAEDNQD